MPFDPRGFHFNSAIGCQARRILVQKVRFMFNLDISFKNGSCYTPVIPTHSERAASVIACCAKAAPSRSRSFRVVHDERKAGRDVLYQEGREGFLGG